MVHSAAAAQTFAPGIYAAVRQSGNANKIIRIAPDGSYESALTVERPFGVAFRDASTLYVTEWTSFTYGQLNAYQPDGTQVFHADGIPATNRFSNGTWPRGIALDAQGNTYIATHNSPGASRVDSSGTVADFTGYAPDLWWGRDAAFSPDGRLFMTHGLFDTGATSRVFEIDPATGAANVFLDGLWNAPGIAFDPMGNMYLSETSLNRVLMVPSGTNSPIPLTTLNAPGNLTFGSDGFLYAVGNFETGDTDHQIWKIDVGTGDKALYASGLPFIEDIAYRIPEPSTLILASVGACILLARCMRGRSAEQH